MASTAARAVREHRRAQARLAEAARQEAKAEALAPKAQRKPVLDPRTGTLLRGPRLERSGTGFVRSSPVRHLWARSQRRARENRDPVVTDAHLAASERLIKAWNETAEGVGPPGASEMQPVGSSRPTSGLGERQQRAILDQIEEHREWRAAKLFLGMLWLPIFEILLLGKDVASFAASRDWDVKVALGYLVAALDRLVEFYQTIAGERRVRVRAVEVTLYAVTG